MLCIDSLYVWFESRTTEELMPYEFEQGLITAEATKNIRGEKKLKAGLTTVL